MWRLSGVTWRVDGATLGLGAEVLEDLGACTLRCASFACFFTLQLAGAIICSFAKVYLNVLV